jgi:hypothetical protein
MQTHERVYAPDIPSSSAQSFAQVRFFACGQRGVETAYVLESTAADHEDSAAGTEFADGPGSFQIAESVVDRCVGGFFVQEAAQRRQFGFALEDFDRTREPAAV